MNKSNNTSWGGVSDWYDNLILKEGTFQKEVILPNLLRLLEIKKGDKILDVACGEGYFSRAYLDEGADVFASDISAELIKIAKEKVSFTPNQNLQKKGDIKYFVSPSDNISFLKDEEVDKATCILAFQNIEKINETINEVARTLKKGGKFIIVMNHPAFRIPKFSFWYWDNETGKGLRAINSYMSESKIDIDMTPGVKDERKKKYTISFHRPLQWYFKIFQKHGFLVERLEEWISHKESQKGKRSEEENKLRKEIPMFLTFVLIKK